MTTKFKIKTVFTPASKEVDKSRLGITEFLIDGIVVCTMRKYREWFCYMQKDGRMSNLRDKEKITFSVEWNEKNIEKLTGKKVTMFNYSDRTIKWDFKNDFPCTRRGFTVNKITEKDVRYYMTSFINKQEVIKPLYKPRFKKDIILSHYQNKSLSPKKYSINWELDDISGNCSPSGSTTLDSGEISFDDISEKDLIVEQLINDYSGQRQSRLYIKLKTYILESEEDIEI